MLASSLNIKPLTIKLMIEIIADTLDCTLDELISDPNTQDGINAKILSLVKRAKKLNVQEQENIALILETAILTAERKTPSTK